MNKNIKPVNKKGEAHGYWQCKWDFVGVRESKTHYVNGIKVGYRELLMDDILTKSYHLI